VTRRERAQVVLLAVVLLLVALLVGVVADRIVLRGVANGPPQRLAAAMGGLFTGGLVFFAGMIAWFIRQRPE